MPKVLLKLGAIFPELPDAMKSGLEAFFKSRGEPMDELEVKRRAESRDLEGLNEGERAVHQYASTRHLDRDGEIIPPEAWDLREYRKAPVKLWGHNYRLPPVGTNVDQLVTDVGLKMKTVYADTGTGTLADTLWLLRKGGHLRTSSVGFVPLERTFRGESKFNKLVDKWRKDWAEFSDATVEGLRVITTKALLLEDSDVTIPANVNALTLAVAKGATPEVLDSLGFRALAEELAAVLKVKSAAPPAKEDAPPDEPTRVVKVVSAAADAPRVVKLISGRQISPEEIARVVKDSLDAYMGRV